MTVLLQVTKVNSVTKELRSKVSKFAGALKDQGITKGDRVIIYMPMIPEAVVRNASLC
jgi:propionyl-CoA synthetase